MLVDAVNDWIEQSRNNSYISSVKNDEFIVRTVNNRVYQHYIEIEEAVYVQVYNTYDRWPSALSLVVIGANTEESDFSYIQKIAKSSNESFLHKKNITAEAVSYNGYNFILLNRP